MCSLKMQAMQKAASKNNVYVHVLIWSLYIVCNVLIQRFLFPGYDDYYGNIFNYLVLILAFYLNAHYVIEKNARRKRIIQLVLLTVLLFAMYMGVLYSFHQFLSPFIYGEPASELNFRSFLYASLYAFRPFLLFSYGYWYILRTIRHQQKINELLMQQKQEKEEKLQLAKERLFYEYSFLQAQINPHFLFNALNFFYSRTLPFSKDVSGGIMKLSEIMRYALENHQDPEGKVALTREINHLRNVIDINQLRFSNTLNIQFTIQGDPEPCKIIPLALITLVENAFKHGDLTNTDHPMVVNLCVSQEEKRLCFKVWNKKNEGPVEFSYGIGMKNMRNRLQWAYANKYELNIIDEDNFYTAELLINL